ncbi:MAG: hypothetical protein JO000_25820 [Alphaproteobacteria bacterium]|nr:hypothetical protein [Alphaproteobacteria bacterium]
MNGCEKAAAAAAGDEGSAATSRRAKRVKVIATTRSRHTRLERRRQAPRFAARLARRSAREDVAEASAPAASPMARRFRGFIDPQPIAQNAFEAMRKPRLMSLDFDAVAVLPVVDLAAAALPTPPAPPAEAAPARPTTVATTQKQDRLVAKPVSLLSAGSMELASAESRPVTLAPVASPAAPATVTAAVTPAPAAAAPTIVTESPPSEPQKSKFSFHGLVLALCGALGAASALRFIVGA